MAEAELETAEAIAEAHPLRVMEGQLTGHIQPTNMSRLVHKCSIKAVNQLGTIINGELTLFVKRFHIQAFFLKKEKPQIWQKRVAKICWD